MALISKARFNQKEKIKLEISSELMKKIEAYCRWSEIDDVSFFFEEAAWYILAKDKEWKVHQKQLKKASKTQKTSA